MTTGGDKVAHFQTPHPKKGTKTRHPQIPGLDPPGSVDTGTHRRDTIRLLCVSTGERPLLEDALYRYGTHALDTSD